MLRFYGGEKLHKLETQLQYDKNDPFNTTLTLTLTPTLTLILTLNPTLATAPSPLLGEKPCIVQFSPLSFKPCVNRLMQKHSLVMGVFIGMREQVFYTRVSFWTMFHGMIPHSLVIGRGPMANLHVRQ